MPASLHIVLAEDDPRTQSFLHDHLTRAGHQVLLARDEKQLMDLCRVCRPDLLIAGAALEGMNALEASRRINETQGLPLILVAADADAEALSSPDADHLMGYVIRPIKAAEMEAAIKLALKRFKHFQQLRQETVALRQMLEDRKAFERAKGILMRRCGMDEEAAFLKLHRAASTRNRRLVQVAERVINAEKVLEEVEHA